MSTHQKILIDFISRAMIYLELRKGGNLKAEQLGCEFNRKIYIGDRNCYRYIQIRVAALDLYTVEFLNSSNEDRLKALSCYFFELSVLCFIVTKGFIVFNVRFKFADSNI